MGDLYLGLISGTSVDGVDAAIVDFDDGKCRILAAETTPYPDALLSRVQALIGTPTTTLANFGAVDVALGRHFGECALKLIRSTGLIPDDIAAIGHHGQTVYHEPSSDEPFSLQIGDPNSIAAITGITTVADFRQLDMAFGGQGAPLVPAFHDWLFRSDQEARVIANIGGIANITVLTPEQAPLGYDTGPGNTLLDGWIQRCRRERYDSAGAWSASGTVSHSLLEHFLLEPYFAASPPKSTGRELFNMEWLNRQLATYSKRELADADIQATLAELSASTIAAALDQPECKLIVCGGGAYNIDLLARLRRLSQLEVETTENYGISPDRVEAVAFAWLAAARLDRVAGNVPTVTGARQAVVLGGVYCSEVAKASPQDSVTRRGYARSKTT